MFKQYLFPPNKRGAKVADYELKTSSAAGFFQADPTFAVKPLKNEPFSKGYRRAKNPLSGTAEE